MQNFSASQVALAKARRAFESALDTATLTSEQHRIAQAAHDDLKRRFTGKQSHLLSMQEQSTADLKVAEERVRASQSEVRRTRAELATAQANFAAFSDPRTSVNSLKTISPFVLLPLRLETRFMTLPGKDNKVQHQLWVRIYPDDCSIDTFEPFLSVTELANAQRYWLELWRAGGIEEDERAAWRTLVTAHGSTRAGWIVDTYLPTKFVTAHGSARAGWIVDTYLPTNLAQKPAKAATDIFLVIGTQTPLPMAQATALATYWQKIWLTGDDQAQAQMAHKEFEATVGATQAPQLLANYHPYNLDELPPDPLHKENATVSVTFVIFPADPPTKQRSWTKAPRVSWLADCFVVLGYIGGAQVLEALGKPVTLPLFVGTDPSSDPSLAIHPENGGLFVPDDLRWLVDFEQAVEVGMGLRIDITEQQAQSGFDRLLVLGLQLSDLPGGTSDFLTSLLRHHSASRSGLELIAQGTPTHNATGRGAGFSRVDDPDVSFENRKKPLFTQATDPLRKRDGQWQAELLGLDPLFFAHTQGAGRDDQMQARGMQQALWPATMGYWMDKLLTPIFDDATIEQTRWFFTNYVSGRGAMPALRIGIQPYGLLPTTAFSRINWLNQHPSPPDTRQTFLAHLLALLHKLDPIWSSLSSSVSHIGKNGDAHQILLDILGLHPASLEFYARSSESLNELFNIINLWGSGLLFWQGILTMQLQSPAMTALHSLGYQGNAEPDILQQIHLSGANRLANLIDDLPLSESEPLRPYTDRGENYIQWLKQAAKTSLDALYQEKGFSEKSPETVLYLFLRYALLLGYYDTSYELHKRKGVLSPQQLRASKSEPVFIHIDQSKKSESRYAMLYKTEASITNSATLLVSDYITQSIGTLPETEGLAGQLDALEILASTPTASLERLFTEHIDCCSYRYDAWLLGLVHYQLETMRQKTRASYLGAYSWLEDLRPNSTQLVPAKLPDDLQETFADLQPLMHDPTNGGYIHAPSLLHAKTAAVLRSGYLASATNTSADTMSVNLSSQRVRLALSLLEGIRNGQSLGALLGYRFERGLHDAHSSLAMDKFIYPLRKAFPLVADSISTTKTNPDVPIEAIEADHVLDGLKLVTRIRTSGQQNYPFGLSGLPSLGSAAEADVLNQEVSSLLDIYDALADLAMAEGLHQAVQGNFERSGATLEAYTAGHFPPEPEVIQTPASGVNLTHRVAIHLQSGLETPVNATPRAMAEPALDGWLAKMLPPLNTIVSQVVWLDPVDKSEHTCTVSLADLNLRPLDILTLMKPDDLQEMTELDDRILRFVFAHATPRPDAELHIHTMQSTAHTFSLFEITPLIRNLKTLTDHARPLRATDATLHNEATLEQDSSVFVNRTRITTPKARLDTLSDDIQHLLSTLAPLVSDPILNRAAIVNGIDDFLIEAVELLARAAAFNLSLCGWGFAYAWRQAIFTDLLEQIRILLKRWDTRLTDYDAAIIAYDALPDSSDDRLRFQELQMAESILTLAFDPLPATPAELRTLLNTKRTTFVARCTQFRSLLNSSVSSVTTLLTALKALLPIDDIDSQAFEVTPFEDRIVLFASDLLSNLQGHLAEIDKRHAEAEAQLTISDAASSNTVRVQALQAGAQALFGSEFKLIPEFILSAEQNDELTNALSASISGDLFRYLSEKGGIDFPIDEWLTGIARVRPSMRAWESIVMLTSALGLPEPVLQPLQLPHMAEDSWLALQFPSNYVLDSDRLLYTAYYMNNFTDTRRQCGLLLDEWTEVIPLETHETGITFNFNRPDNEAPQAILLVTPATAGPNWQWADLIGALNETLDLAKKRAVEPSHLDQTVYARLLPATIMAQERYEVSISTSLTAVNGLYEAIQEKKNA